MDDERGEVASRPAVTVEGGGAVMYRASALGSCTRALAAARQELEPYSGPLPAKIAEVFERGHEAEEYGVRWFEARGWRVWDRQKGVVLDLTPRIRVVGHIDFKVTKDEQPYPTVVDAKSQNEEEFAKRSIRDSIFWGKYEWQFAAYREATGLPIAVQRICGEDVKLEPITWELPGKGDILGRILEVERLAAGELKGECDQGDYPCPYFHLFHRGEEYVEVEDEGLADLALHYARLKTEIDPLEGRRREIREALIKQVGGEDGRGRIRETVSGIEVRVTTSETKERIIPAGSMVRLSVRLPKGQGQRETGDETDR